MSVRLHHLLDAIPDQTVSHEYPPVEPDLDDSFISLIECVLQAKHTLYLDMEGLRCTSIVSLMRLGTFAGGDIESMLGCGASRKNWKYWRMGT